MDHVHKHQPKYQNETESLTVGPVQPALYKNLEVHPVKTIQENLLVNAEK